MKGDPRQLDLYRRPDPDPGIAEESADTLTVDRIAAIIGVEGAQALMRALGGTRVYIPRAPRQDSTTSPIIMVLGWELADKLAVACGGEQIQVPLFKSRAARRRDREQIVRLHREGKTIASIALRVGCSERHVYNVLSSPLKWP